MPKFSRHLRVGLQLKAVLVLTVVVIAVMAAGGWFYFSAARRSLRGNDLRHGARLGEALGLAAQDNLRQRREPALQRLVSGFVANDNVRYVILLDRQGNVVASASRGAEASRYSTLAELPVAISDVHQAEPDALIIARPIVATGSGISKDELVGAVRLVLDTSDTTGNLAEMRQRMAAAAAGIVFCATPLGFLLVWRVMVQPFRRLVSATRRLAEGDFTARTSVRRNDEIGELAAAFDVMADEVSRMRDELVTANQRLERKVTERTAELQQANHRLRAEMAEKEDFLRAVSHDLNAPLRNIAGMATMAMMKWGQRLPEQVMDRLRRIRANVDAGSTLITELLELSRIKTSPQDRRVVDIEKLLSDLTRTFEFELKARKIKLEIDRPLPSLYVEKNRIRQVFQNLIDNAIKYMHRRTGGRIDVGYDFIDGMQRFWVADNGPGISADQQQKIFYVFRRAQSPASADTEGKGIGLAVVKTVVCNYGGQAWVQSQPGEGATFYFTLDGQCTKPPGRESQREFETDSRHRQVACRPAAV